MSLAAGRDPRAKALAAGRAWGRQLESPAPHGKKMGAKESIDHLVGIARRARVRARAPRIRRGAADWLAALPVPRTRRDPGQCRLPDPPGAHARSPGKLGGTGRCRPTGRVRRTGSVSGPPHAGRSHPVSAGSAVAVAVTFVWLGMVLAISFLEAPLKFRAPNVTQADRARDRSPGLPRAKQRRGCIRHRHPDGHRGQRATSGRHRSVRRRVRRVGSSARSGTASVEPSF